MGSVETSNRIHAAGTFAPLPAPPFALPIIAAKGVQSFTRLSAGQYRVVLDQGLSFKEGFAVVGGPPQFLGTGGAQIEPAGTVFVSFYDLGSGAAVDPRWFSLAVVLFNEGEGVGPTLPVPAPPPPFPVGPVLSVFGRVGIVVAMFADYAASLIANDSLVAGVSVKDALNNLLAAIPAIAVTSVFGRIGAVVAAAGDYSSTQVTNVSLVVGATVTDALNTLLAVVPPVPVTSVFGRIGAVVAAAGDYTSTLITNSSAVAGTTVTDALNTLDQGINYGQAYAQVVRFPLP